MSIEKDSKFQFSPRTFNFPNASKEEMNFISDLHKYGESFKGLDDLKDIICYLYNLEKPQSKI
jgi:hypothetical protein